MDYCREYKKETLYTILGEKYRTRGGCTALEYRDVTYSWDELDKLSGLTADDLFRLGAGPGDHIGIIGMNSANWVIALFAICRLGAVAVLLNYSLKASELMLAVDTADINYLCYGDGTVLSVEEDFSRDPCLKCASEKLRGMLCISDKAGLRKRMDEAARCRYTYCYDAGYDSPSFILFTSGSSGVPKGVQLTPFGVINNADIVGEMLGLTENDSLCLALPLFHSFGLTCGLITSLLYNNVVHIPDSFHRNDLLQCIHINLCTVVHAVPTLFLSMIGCPDFGTYATSQVRTSIIGGTPVIWTQLKKLMESFPNDHFRVSYGMTETSPWVCSTEYEDTDEHMASSVGRPGPGQQARIADPVTGTECPCGRSGELLLKGYNIIPEYYGLPECEQPFDSEGWLHTGDLAFIAEDGYIHLTGRRKELIIRGGENISPAEIETALLECPGIRDAKVVGVPSPSLGEKAAACIVMDEGTEIDEGALRRRLAERLSDYKIPSYFFTYDELPVLSNGKPDSVRLKAEAAEKAKSLR